MTLCSVAAPASAEIGATVSVFSDQRFRGFSLSDDRPVGIADFAYDSASGFYLDGSGSLILRRALSPAPLSLQLAGGYAKRFASGTTLDFGITHSSYSHYSNGRQGQSYSEVYAGIARGIFSSRLFVSPHYFTSGRWTAYGEVNADFSPARLWGLEAHLGMLSVLRTPSGQPYHANVDWRIGASRRLGRISLHAALTGYGRGPQPFGAALRQSPRRNALVVGLTASL